LSRKKFQDACLDIIRRVLASSWDKENAIEAKLAKEDNFLLLRFFAASLVLLSHCFDTLGIPGGDFLSRSPLDIGFNLGIVGVCIFFFVSGFLVAGSYMRRRSAVAFFVARVLRIYPAYMACVILCALVIGTSLTSISWTQYLSEKETITYISTNALLGHLQWGLPGLFLDNPHPQNVNASLWTLPGEVRMYFYVLVFGSIGALSNRLIANLVLLSLTIFTLFADSTLPLLDYPDHLLPLAGLFAGGAFCYINRAWVPVTGRIALALFLATAISHGQIIYKPLALISIAYGSLWFAYCTPWHGFNRFGDYSYGVYLWNWPIQQAIWQVAKPATPLVMFLLSYPVVIALAVLSWSFVERPALRLKFRNARGVGERVPPA